MEEQKRQLTESIILRWIERYDVKLSVNQKHALLYEVIPELLR